MKKMYDKASEFAAKVVRNGKAVAATVAGAGLMVATQVHAAIPAEATTAFDGLEADGVAMIGKGWAVAGAVVGGLLLIKLFKKVASRST